MLFAHKRENNKKIQMLRFLNGHDFVYRYLYLLFSPSPLVSTSPVLPLWLNIKTTHQVQDPAAKTFLSKRPQLMLGDTAH